MNGLEVAGAIVGGVAVVVGSAVGAFYLLLTVETRRMQRNRALAERVTS